MTAALYPLLGSDEPMLERSIDDGPNCIRRDRLEKAGGIADCYLGSIDTQSERRSENDLPRPAQDAARARCCRSTTTAGAGASSRCASTQRIADDVIDCTRARTWALRPQACTDPSGSVHGAAHDL